MGATIWHAQSLTELPSLAARTPSCTHGDGTSVFGIPSLVVWTLWRHCCCADRLLSLHQSTTTQDQVLYSNASSAALHVQCQRYMIYYSRVSQVNTVDYNYYSQSSIPVFLRCNHPIQGPSRAYTEDTCHECNQPKENSTCHIRLPSLFAWQ